MRNIGAVLLLLVTSFFAMTAPSMAQSNLRTCAGVDLTAPADGAVLDPGYRTNFTWDSEPRGTASREWVSVRVDLDADEGSFSFEDAKKAKAEPRLYKGFARGTPGIYAWAVIFYDANGNPICQSEARTYVVVGSGFASLSGTSSAAAAVKAALGRYVVSLVGASGNDGVFGGTVNHTVKDDYYNDADWQGTAYDWQAQGYEGLDIHGSKKSDKIIGSEKGDNIWGHGGNDLILGDPTLVGLGGNDVINGGDGKDAISGGSGDDIIHGDAGNDAISGDGGADKVYGDSGNDAITGNYPLNFEDGANDLVSGGADFDIAVGSGGDVVNP